MRNRLITASFLSAAMLFGAGCQTNPAKEETVDIALKGGEFQFVS